MCLACEEAALWHRWQLLQQIARGEMPDGMTADDLRAMDLPLPGEITLVEEPDGTVSIRKAPEQTPPKAFVCDSPDGE
jgi:hypothetical protein